MSVEHSPTPSLIEERHEKKRRLLSWIMAQARGMPSGSIIQAKPKSPHSPSSTVIPESPTALTASGSEPTMNEAYLTQAYGPRPPDAKSTQDSAFYSAYPGPTPYIAQHRQMPISQTQHSITPEPAPASYTPNNGPPNNATNITVGVSNGTGISPSPMTTITFIPGVASSPPTVAPQPAPISSPGIISHDYANPAPPTRERRPMKSAVNQRLREKVPAFAHSSRQPLPHSGPIHREELDPPASRSRDVSRSPASQYSTPSDYVPASQAPARSRSRSRRRYTRERPVTPSPDRSRAPAPNTTHQGYYSPRASPSATVNRDIPRQSHHYSFTPHHGHDRDRHHHNDPGHRHHHSGHGHGHHHGDHGHKHHHGDHGHSRHRSSSQPAHHPGQLYRQYEVQPSSARPTYARQRSHSVDEGDSRMRMPRSGAAYTSHGYGYGSGYGSTTHPQMMPQPQTAYPNYTRSQPTAPTTAGMGTSAPADSTGHYRIIVQPPASARSANVHQPVGVPVKDGMGGWSVVPQPGQNVHVVQNPSTSGTNATPSRDVRGRQSSPGFWGNLFGRKKRSSSAAPGTRYPQSNTQPAYYSHGHRPRHSRRRSSQ